MIFATFINFVGYLSFQIDMLNHIFSTVYMHMEKRGESYIFFVLGKKNKKALVKELR